MFRSLLRREKVPDVLACFGAQNLKLVFISHPGVMAITRLMDAGRLFCKYRANFTQENIDELREWDPQLADKAQIAFDNDIKVNFTNLEYIDREKYLQQFVKEKETLDKIRKEVFALPPGKYDQTPSMKTYVGQEISFYDKPALQPYIQLHEQYRLLGMSIMTQLGLVPESRLAEALEKKSERAKVMEQLFNQAPCDDVAFQPYYEEINERFWEVKRFSEFLFGKGFDPEKHIDLETLQLRKGVKLPELTPGAKNMLTEYAKTGNFTFLGTTYENVELAPHWKKAIESISKHNNIDLKIPGLQAKLSSAETPKVPSVEAKDSKRISH